MKKNNTITILISVFVFQLISLNVCYAQRIENKNGIRIVHNEGNGEWAQNPKIGLKLIGTLGEFDASDDNFLFYLPEGIVVDNQGNKYVLDSGNHRIQKYDQSGMYLKTIGSEGDGPGEFRCATSIDIDKEDNIHISERYVKDFEVFTSDGRTISSKSLKGKLGEFKLLPGGKLVTENHDGVFSIFDEKAQEKLPDMFKITDMNENIHTKFGKMEFFIDNNTTPDANKNVFTADKNGNIFVSYSTLNKIEKYSSDGKLLMKIDRPLNFEQRIEKTEVIRSEADGTRIKRGDNNKISKAIAVDDKGRIWNITYRRQEKKDENVRESMSINTDDDGSMKVSRKIRGDTDIKETDLYMIEIFDADGILLQKIELDHFVDDITIYGSTLYLMDKFRGSQFYMYEIIVK